MAIAYWNIVLAGGRFIHLDIWVKFLKVRIIANRIFFQISISNNLEA